MQRSWNINFSKKKCMQNAMICITVTMPERKKKMKSMFGIIASLLFTSSIALADPVSGPIVDNDLLRPGQTVRYTVACNADETTLFVVRGDGDGDIDCCLFDGNANVIACDNSSADGCSLRVVPAWTGRFFFVATNNGRYSSYYRFSAI